VSFTVTVAEPAPVPVTTKLLKVIPGATVATAVFLLDAERFGLPVSMGRVAEALEV